MLSETLTVALAKEIFGAIKYFLSKKKSSEKEREKLREELIRLVELSKNTAVALEHYFTFMKRSTEAGVHCTELHSLIETIPENSAMNQFAKIIDVRLKANLREEAIEAIHNYRVDFEQARHSYMVAKRHLRQAKINFRKNKEDCSSEIEEDNDEISQMVMLGSRRIRELIDPLQEAL